MKKVLWVLGALLGLLTAYTVFDYVRGRELAAHAKPILEEKIAVSNRQKMESLCNGRTQSYAWGGLRCITNHIPLSIYATLSGEERDALYGKESPVLGVHRVHILVFRRDQRNPEGCLIMEITPSGKMYADYTHQFNTLLEPYDFDLCY